MEKQPIPAQFTQEQGQNTGVEGPFIDATGMSLKERNNLEWLEQKTQSEQWNQAHFTGWKGGRYFVNGQVM